MAPQPTETMRRYVLANHSADLSGITLQEDVSIPCIKTPTEILVRIRGVSLNARDLQLATGTYPVDLGDPTDRVPVSDGSGEVVAVGEGVTEYQVGDKVLTITLPGHHYAEDPTHASILAGLGGGSNGVATEYFSCDEANVVKIPKHFTYQEASTIPITYATAWAALYGYHPTLKSGQTVLCQGTGGVSLCAAQIALIAGSRIIITSSSQTKLDRAVLLLSSLVKGNIEDQIKTIDYSKIPEWHEQVRRLTAGQGADFVIDIAGRTTLTRSIKSARAGGFVAVIGYLSDYAPCPQALGEEDIAKIILLSSAYVRGVFACNREAMKELISALELANVKPIIDKSFDFVHLKDAYQYMADGKHFGKVVVTV